MLSVETGSFGNWASEGFFPSPLRLGHQAEDWHDSSHPNKNKNKHSEPFFKINVKVVQRKRSTPPMSQFQGGTLSVDESQNNLFLHLCTCTGLNQSEYWISIYSFGNLGNPSREPSRKETSCEEQQRHSGRSLD